MGDTIHERLATLLSRKLSGEATAEEDKELQQWMQDNPEDNFFAELLYTYWNNHTPASYITKTADAHFDYILQKAAQPVVQPQPATPSFQKTKIVRYAAAALLLLLAGFMWMRYDKGSGHLPQQNEIVAARGAKSQLQLPDGTRVWLNSDSKLKFDKDFKASTREVVLEGEAFFDVAKDAQRPFIVHTSAIDIKVLGTAFNVKSYDAENSIETTLIHGLVEVTNKLQPAATKIFLKPKEKLVFIKEPVANSLVNNTAQEPAKTQTLPTFAVTHLSEKLIDSSLTETAWIYNRLIFEGDRFKDLATKMERWFNVSIHFKSEKIANYRLRGAFQNETIEQALAALQLIAPFRYKIVNNVIEISQ